MTPDFLITGAMKAGTTSLAYQLDAHPDIAMSHPKEPDFFSEDAVWARGWDWYESCFSHAADKPLRGDASTSYAKWPLYSGVAERIARHRPDVKIIYMVRNPIDRAVSHYRHRWFGRTMPKDCTFSAYLKFDETMVQFGLYYRQLTEYLRHFDSSRIKVVVSEDYYADPAAVGAEICDFLGARNDCRPEVIEKHNASESKVRKAQWLVALRQSKLIPPGLRKMLPEAMRRRVRNIRGTCEPPPVNLRDHAGELLDVFLPDVRQLSEFLDRDMVDFWNLTPEACELPSRQFVRVAG